MSVNYNPKIVTDGLIHLLEGSKANGTTSQTISNPIAGSEWTANNFSIGNTGSLGTFLSNVDSTGAGNSVLRVSPNSNLTTGSITAIIWFNLKNIPIDVGGVNNWRGLLSTNTGGTNGNPLTMVLEQTRQINFSTTHSDIYRRHLNSQFAPVIADANGWQMVTYTYDKDSGIAACYKNNVLITTGPMTSNTSGGSPTAANTSLVYTNYTSGSTETGFRVYAGSNVTANPAGNGICPGEVSNVMFYNRALSAQEIAQNFNALRGRFGV